MSRKSPSPLTGEGRGEGENDAVKKYRAERVEIFKQYEARVDFCLEKTNRLLREMATDYLRYAVETSRNHRTTEGFVPLDTPHGLLLLGGTQRWQAMLASSAERAEPFFKLWHQLIVLPRDGFAEMAKPVLADMQAHPADFHPLVVAAFKDKSPATMLDVADIYGSVIADALKSKSPEGHEVAELLFGPDSPIPVSCADIREDFTHFSTEFQIVLRPDGEVAGQLREKLTTLEAGRRSRGRWRSVRQPSRSIRTFSSAATFVSRAPRFRGDSCKSLTSVDDRQYADDGRLELAQAIASAKNPLTARVIVNRVWQHHFGQGLVATPDNFGAMGDRPSHPELLEHLTSWFIDHGWSLKALHRYILTSAVWQQAGASNSPANEKDPLNRLLWRMPPRRLEFEPMRDSLLYVAGRLDTKLGGRGAPLDDGNTRRAIYGYTDRFRIPALLRNFDAANPDTSISRRSQTINPLQALYFMNSPFVRAQAESVLRQPDVAAAKTADERLVAVYRRVLSLAGCRRSRAARAYLSAAALDDPVRRQWVNLIQGLLLSNEFVFVE